MAPLIVLIASFPVFYALHKAGFRLLPSWIVCLRWALAAMFLLTASAHWGSRRADLVAMVPDGLPNHELLVTVTGIAEIAGALGLLVPRVAPLSAAGLALLLLAVFPANIHAARESLSIGGTPAMPLVPRALLQVVFLAALLLAGFRKPRAPGQAASQERSAV